jgi:hypothetical protein
VRGAFPPRYTNCTDSVHANNSSPLDSRGNLGLYSQSSSPGAFMRRPARKAAFDRRRRYGPQARASLPRGRWSAGRRPCPTSLGTRARKRPPLVTGTGRGARRACVNGPLGADSSTAPGRLSALHFPFGERKTETGAARAANNRAGGALAS